MSGSAVAASSPGATRRGAFGRGFWNPNPVILVVGLLVTLIGVAGLQHFVTTGRFTVIPEARFVRTPHDDWGNVSYQVGELKRHTPGHRMVYMLGGSNIRESIPSDQSLAAALNAASGAGAGQSTASVVDVRDFGSMNQNFGESMAVVDNLQRTGGVVIIGVNQSRFAYSSAVCEDQIKGRELLMASPALNAFARSKGRGMRVESILPGILGYITSYVQQNESTLLTGHLPYHRYEQHKYTETRIAPRGLKESFVHRWLSKQGRPGGEFDQYFAYNGQLLDTMVKLARARGFQVVLLECPENVAVVGARFDRYKQVYQPFLRGLAAKDGATYVDLNPSLKLTNGDFFDLTHLVETGRAKWQSGLVKALTPILGQPAGTTVTK